MNPICQRCLCELDVKAPKVLSYNHCPECLCELEEEHFAAIAARDALLRKYVERHDYFSRNDGSGRGIATAVFPAGGGPMTIEMGNRCPCALCLEARKMLENK